MNYMDFVIEIVALTGYSLEWLESKYEQELVDAYMQKLTPAQVNDKLFRNYYRFVND